MTVTTLPRLTVSVDPQRERAYWSWGAWHNVEVGEFTRPSPDLLDTVRQFWSRVIDQFGHTITARYNEYIHAFQHVDLTFTVDANGTLRITGFEYLDFDVFELCFPHELMADAPCDLNLCLYGS